MMSFQESFHKMDDMLRDPAYAKAAFFLVPMFWGIAALLFSPGN